jgi:hypothetical protein
MPFLIDTVLFEAIQLSNLFFHLAGFKVPRPELLVFVYFLQFDNKTYSPGIEFLHFIQAISGRIKDGSFCSLNENHFRS